MLEIYNSNTDFKAYVDKYSMKQSISIEVALTHEITKLYLQYLLNK